MNEKFNIKLTIGEFSKLCYVTVKTLRHYEKMGILIPHEIDEWTHYRYYDVSQMEQMNNILRLKAMGLSLEEIRHLQEEGDDIPTCNMVNKALEKAQEELCQLRNRIAALQQMQGLATKTKEMSTFTIKPLPGGTVANFRKQIKSYDELGPLCCEVIGPEMQRLRCECPEETAYCYTVDYNKNFIPNDIDIEYCEIVTKYDSADSKILTFRQIPVVEKALCFDHRGSYNTFGESMAIIFKYIEENNLKIANDPRFSYIHGVWDCDSIEDWLTEIQVPLY